MIQDEGDRKPGSVPPELPSGDDHSSGTGVADCLKRPNPEAAGEQPVSHLIPPRFRGRWKMGTPPYLVLLRVGFTESRCHHRDWCALTAPFHPYQARCTVVIRSLHGLGGLFSVALSLGLPPLDVIQHPALRSPDFPPSTWQRRAIIWSPSSQKRQVLFSTSVCIHVAVSKAVGLSASAVNTLRSYYCGSIYFERWSNEHKTQQREVACLVAFVCAVRNRDRFLRYRSGPEG